MTGPLAGRSILVVEDEMLVLLNIETALTDLGCTAIAAATIDGALTLLDDIRFDAAMLDVNLHGQKSYPVADALALRGIPFVFSTGYGHHRDRPDFADRPVLRKPYPCAHLVAALSALVGPQAPTRPRRNPHLAGTYKSPPRVEAAVRPLASRARRSAKASTACG